MKSTPSRFVPRRPLKWRIDVKAKSKKTAGELSREVKDRRDEETFGGKPSLKALVAAGKISKESVPGGIYRQLHAMRFRLKEERERRGWTLAQLAEAAGIDAPALSRFERGVIPQPTFATV